MNTRHAFKFLSLLYVVLLLGLPTVADAQQDMKVYDDTLENGWEPYGYPTTTINYASPNINPDTPTISTVRSGMYSIAVTAPSYTALYIHHAPFDTGHYTALVFWVSGGTTGGQHLRVQATRGGISQVLYRLPDPSQPSASLSPNEWHQVVIPLDALSVAGVTDMDGFWIMNDSSNAAATFYVDDISLRGDAPASIQIQADRAVRTVDDRFFGVNLATTDGYLNPSKGAGTASLLGSDGIAATTLRWPGGSLSDRYHWKDNRLVEWQTGLPSSVPYEQNPIPIPAFANMASSLGAQVYLTVNYGSGTPQEAAALVAYLNGRVGDMTPLGKDTLGTDWLTVDHWASLRAAPPTPSGDPLQAGHPAPYGFRYFEVGNEVWGTTWECDLHGLAGSHLSGSAHDPVTYGTQFANFWNAMKAVDPTIKIGVVAEYGEGFSDWTGMMLSSVAGTGIIPDFAAQHWYTALRTDWYYETPGTETDEGLFASNDLWASNAQTLRTQLETAFPAKSPGLPNPGDGVEMVVTENNSVYNNSGKQATSLTDGLYMADSIGHALQTGYSGLLWWDLRDYQNTMDGPPNLDEWLYGWRPYGDFGMINTTGTVGNISTVFYPTFYIAKLLKHFVRGGDIVVRATSDDALLSAFGAKRSNGSLSLLIVNKSKIAAIKAAVELAGFAPTVDSTVYTYGIPQDSTLDPASPVFGQYSADVDVAAFTGAAPSFTYEFPPYSVTLLSMVPMPVLASLTVDPQAVVGGLTTSGSVTLTSPAPSGGVTVTLLCSGMTGDVPASVIIPAGQISQSFSIRTSPVAQQTVLTLMAQLNGVQQTATLSISPPTLASLTLPSSTSGGTVVTATVMLNGIASSDVVVGLSSSDSSVVRLHRAVIVPAGSSSATFEINTYRSHTTKTVTIQAVQGNVMLTRDLIIAGR